MTRVKKGTDIASGSSELSGTEIKSRCQLHSLAAAKGNITAFQLTFQVHHIEQDGGIQLNIVS